MDKAAKGMGVGCFDDGLVIHLLPGYAPPHPDPLPQGEGKGEPGRRPSGTGRERRMAGGACLQTQESRVGLVRDGSRHQGNGGGPLRSLMAVSGYSR